MGQLDMTLDSLILPNIATFTPAFGTKKGQPKKGLSTLEGTLNAMLPFSRMRPFIASENSTTTEIQANSVIVAAGQTAAITLAAGAYIGCGLIVLNTTSHTVDVLAGISVFTFDPGEILPLIYMPGGWMRTNHLPPGIVMHSALNEYALAQERLLPLTGAVLPIADYPGLCRRVYAGDSLNATAPTFYRTSDAAGTTRNTAGQYMTTPNAKGVFLRGAGSQRVIVYWQDSQGGWHNCKAGGVPGNVGEIGADGKTIVDTLYDGGDIAEFRPDTIRTLTGEGGRVVGTHGSLSGSFYSWGQLPEGGAGSIGSVRLAMDSSLQSPGGTNTAPGSVSCMIVISY
jgi:hypothetical protein